MQYVIAKFRETDTRTYTYHNDGPDVASGDFVRVEDARGGGWKKVWVVGVTDEKPSFPTKPILGLHVETPTELDLADEVPFLTGVVA